MKLLPRLALVLCLAALLTRAWSSVPPAITRGPYLQDASATATKLVCRTSATTALTVRFGERRGVWEGSQTTSSGTTHVFTLTGLSPETNYAYEISAGTSVLAGSPDHVFRTAPPDASRAPFRFLAWGDSGTGTSGQRDLAEVMESVLPMPTFALGLGDLVYDRGEWENYDPRLFQPYAPLFRRMPFWPAMGNHDIDTDNGAPYFDAFHLPVGSGASGFPSGTELYYSFDHGMAHFTCLDSESTDTSPGGRMYRWAEADLDAAIARGKRWLFVFMHHPPYTRGTHDSTEDVELIELANDLVPLFDAKDVDMVLVGHSHVYERSYLARAGSVLQDDRDEYTKIASPDGTLYIVTGCAGKTGTGELDHPLMARSYGNVLGFNVIDVGWEEVRGRFIEDDRTTTDLFTLRKATDTKPPRIALARVESDTTVKLVFDEPVRDGTSGGGAENRASYAFSPAIAVLEAELDSDRSTVELTTSPLAGDQAYVLDVHGVADTAGLVVNQSVTLGQEGSGGGGLVSLIPRSALWRWAKGLSAPPASWATPGFDFRGMSLGRAGFGYADGDDATVLADMRDRYVTVYARRLFFVADPDLVEELRLDVSYDDGFVAFLNGAEVARSNVPTGQTWTTEADAGLEANGFESFDLTGHRNRLVAGLNVLAIEGHNTAIDSNDFSLHPELSASFAGGSSAPLVVAPVRTANAPARLAFSAELPRGAAKPDTLAWDFGDGSATAHGPEVEHVFTSPGHHRVTLTARDAAGHATVAEVPVRIHEQGVAPRAFLAASAAVVDAGDSLGFDARASHDPDGGAVTFRWDFGDRSSGERDRSSDAATTHAFSAPGTYRVQVVVTDDEGSSVVAATTITVE